MIAVDTNIIVYAHRTDSPFHAAADKCVERLVEGTATWAIPWPCIHEFLAVVTNPRAYRPPSAIEVAVDQIRSLFESPRLILLAETDRYWETLERLVVSGQVRGGQVHDARIAAICLGNGVAELWSADRDFGRFPELRVVNPLVGRS